VQCNEFSCKFIIPSTNKQNNVQRRKKIPINSHDSRMFKTVKFTSKTFYFRHERGTTFAQRCAPLYDASLRALEPCASWSMCTAAYSAAAHCVSVTCVEQNHVGGSETIIVSSVENVFFSRRITCGQKWREDVSMCAYVLELSRELLESSVVRSRSMYTAVMDPDDDVLIHCYFVEEQHKKYVFQLCFCSRALRACLWFPDLNGISHYSRIV
jgi:hypothetical protein